MSSVSVTLQPPPIPQKDYFESDINKGDFILVTNPIKDENDKVIKATCFYVLSVRGEGTNAVLTLQYVSGFKNTFKVSLKGFIDKKIYNVVELRITKSKFVTQLDNLTRVYNDTNKPSVTDDDYKEITKLKLGLTAKKEQMAKLNTARAEAERRTAYAEREAAKQDKKAEEAKRKSAKEKKKAAKAMKRTLKKETNTRMEEMKAEAVGKQQGSVLEEFEETADQYAETKLGEITNTKTKQILKKSLEAYVLKADLVAFEGEMEKRKIIMDEVAAQRKQFETEKKEAKQKGKLIDEETKKKIFAEIEKQEKERIKRRLLDEQTESIYQEKRTEKTTREKIKMLKEKMKSKAKTEASSDELKKMQVSFVNDKKFNKDNLKIFSQMDEAKKTELLLDAEKLFLEMNKSISEQKKELEKERTSQQKTETKDKEQQKLKQVEQESTIFKDQKKTAEALVKLFQLKTYNFEDLLKTLPKETNKKFLKKQLEQKVMKSFTSNPDVDVQSLMNGLLSNDVFAGNEVNVASAKRGGANPPETDDELKNLIYRIIELLGDELLTMDEMTLEEYFKTSSHFQEVLNEIELEKEEFAGFEGLANEEERELTGFTPENLAELTTPTATTTLAQPAPPTRKNSEEYPGFGGGSRHKGKKPKSQKKRKPKSQKKRKGKTQKGGKPKSQKRRKATLQKRKKSKSKKRKLQLHKNTSKNKKTKKK